MATQPGSTKLNKNVIVREREFKSDRAHQGNITAIVKLDDNEFLTASEDCCLKVWDKQLQGVSYTYETTGPLKTANRTGETGKKDVVGKNFLVVGLGDGHFVNYGVTTRNECMMKIWAHAHPIISIVSLGGYLKNKYFATRCSDGHVSIWSSTNKPEKIFTLEHMDSDKDKLQHLQPVKEEEVIEVVVKKKKKGDGDEDEDEDEDVPAEEEPPAEEEEEAKKKKKVVNEPPKVTPLIGRLEPSARDTMIEIKWKGLIN